MTNQEYCLDLHTHSIISHDGGITLEQYRRIFDDARAYVAITDHNEISFASALNKDLGQRVIVGEEIMTLDGEIIGLFLKQRIAPHLSAEETINQIKLQSGLVYIPHPLEQLRRGLSMGTLKRIISQIDIIEVFNARTKERWLSKKVEQFASEHELARASSSDAHGIRGFGSAYSLLHQFLNKETLVSGLRQAELIKKPAPFFSQLNPLTNKLKKKFKL